MQLKLPKFFTSWFFTGLCKEQWPEAAIYDPDTRKGGTPHFKKIYLRLDEGTLTFNSDAEKGMSYFFDNGLLSDKPADIARFFHSTDALSKAQIRQYLQRGAGGGGGSSNQQQRAAAAFRQAVMACMVEMQDYRGQFLPNALRKCFSKLEAPDDRGAYLQRLLAAFSQRFCQCNPGLGYSVGKILHHRNGFSLNACCTCRNKKLGSLFRRRRLRDVLLTHPALRGPDVAARPEQDVQAGIHSQHPKRCRAGPGGPGPGRQQQQQ